MDARNETTVEPASERELVITRVFDVPARILFLACSKPEHMMKWFGPKGYPLTLCEMDFRVGGKWRYAMSCPSGEQMAPFGGEYLVIEPNRTISYSNTSEMPGAETMISTLTFSESNGKTTLVLHTLFASIAMKRKHVEMGFEQGVGSGLDQLVDVASRLAAA